MGETEGRRGEGDEMSITQSFSISCVDNVVSPLDLQPVDSSSYILMSIYICSFHCSESWLITAMPIQWNGSFGATVIHCECIYLSVTLNFVSIALSTRFVYLDSRLSVLATTLRGTISQYYNTVAAARFAPILPLDQIVLVDALELHGRNISPTLEVNRLASSRSNGIICVVKL